jgi:hypothetical protein
LTRGGASVSLAFHFNQGDVDGNRNV